MYKEKDNPLRDKSYAFALSVVKIITKLQEEKKEYVLTRHLIRSATSIGANVEEAIGGQSGKDFLHKISISYKEARESSYWIRLLRDSDYLDASTAASFLENVDELLRIMTSIQKSMKSRLNN